MLKVRISTGLLLAVVATVSGCAFPFGMGKTSQGVIDPKPANKVDASKPAATTSATTPAADAASTKPVDAKTMADVMAEMQKMGALDPESAAQLAEDLKKTDPALWPQTLEAFQATLAYRRQIEEKSRSRGETPASSFASDRDSPQTPRAAASYAAPATVIPGSFSPPGNSLMPPSQPATTTARILPAGLGSDTPATQSATSASSTATTDSALARVGESATRPATNVPVTAATLPNISPLPPVNPGSPVATYRTDGVADKAAADKTTSDKATEKTSPAQDLWPTAGTGRVSLASRTAQAEDAGLDWREHLDLSIRQLERETAEVPGSNGDVNRHVALRMLYLVAGRRDDALRPIPGISASQQDFWSKEFYGLSTYLDSQRISDPGRRAVEAASHLQEAAHRLCESGPLNLKNLAFCNEVKSFGVYKKFEKYEFKPDQNVILYAEVQNFKIESSEKGYRTALRSSYQILDSHGNRVAEHEYPVAEEVCQNPRSDFFFPLILTLPHRINDGDYTLQLTLEDTLSQKLSQSSIALTIRDAVAK